MVSIDAEKGTINIELSEAELTKRRSEWKQPPAKYRAACWPNMSSSWGRRAMAR